MAGRGDTAIAALAMAAAGLVIAAPVLGRLGLPGPADAAMAGAALCGLGAFARAALDTLRAARRAEGGASAGGARDPQGGDS